MWKVVALAFGILVANSAIAGVAVTDRPYSDGVGSVAQHDKKIPYKTVSKQVDGKQADIAKISPFVVHKGERLSVVLNRWAKKRGGDAIWRAKRDFIIKANASYHGDLPGVIEALLNSMGEEVSDKIIVTVFQNGYIRVDDAEDTQ